MADGKFICCCCARRSSWGRYVPCEHCSQFVFRIMHSEPQGPNLRILEKAIYNQLGWGDASALDAHMLTTVGYYLIKAGTDPKLRGAGWFAVKDRALELLQPLWQVLSYHPKESHNAQSQGQSAG